MLSTGISACSTKSASPVEYANERFERDYVPDVGHPSTLEIYSLTTEPGDTYNTVGLYFKERGFNCHELPAWNDAPATTFCSRPIHFYQGFIHTI